MSTQPYRLFSAPRDPRSAARLRPQAYLWGAYAHGYRRAAEVLIDEALGQPAAREFLSFALVYNCRHWLELALKNIISCAHEAHGIQRLPPDTHNLHSLWDYVSKMAKADSPGEDPLFYEPIELLVRELHALDSRSDAFRYPVDTSGSPSLPSLGDFELQQFADAVRDAMWRVAGIEDYYCEWSQAERQAW